MDNISFLSYLFGAYWWVVLAPILLLILFLCFRRQSFLWVVVIVILLSLFILNPRNPLSAALSSAVSWAVRYLASLI